jgi:hypothetical protein
MTYGWSKTSLDASLTKSPLIRIVPLSARSDVVSMYNSFALMLNLNGHCNENLSYLAAVTLFTGNRTL